MTPGTTACVPARSVDVTIRSGGIDAGSNAFSLVFDVVTWNKTGSTSYVAHTGVSLQQLELMDSSGTTAELDEHGVPTVVIIGGQALECYAHAL
ncbi:hypothetical protein CYG49_00400 [Candidatus Saccharibacteria bacterium]|nr:MAG: hypothetical protein CYG49_00400 [Candidatus Saccharibacteria bacterium]